MHLMTLPLDVELPLTEPDEGPLSDSEWAFHIYEMIASPATDLTELMLFKTLPGDPWSKSRPRFSRRGPYVKTYSKSEDIDAERRTADALRTLNDGKHLTGNVALGCVFFRSNRQRIDTDNLLKHICDAATGVLWVDDSQVTCLFGRIELDKENPRTLVVVGHDASTLTRGSDAVKHCEFCGKPFSVVGTKQRAAKRFCTQRCARTASTGGIDLSELVNCVACQQPFRRQTSSQKYCSGPCAWTQFRKPRPARRVAHPCIDCGGQRARTNSQRCRACWIAARGKGLA